MPVQIGATTHSFGEPTGLLSDCHRRIETFLGTLVRLSEFDGRELDDEARAALQGALKYFKEAAPKHTADEEESLFPRMRRMKLVEVEEAIRKLDPLEKEHRRADLLHAEVDELGGRWLAEGKLAAPDAQRFREDVAQLASIYKEHIRIEDEVVFPVAGRLLPAAEKAAIAREMEARRK